MARSTVVLLAIAALFVAVLSAAALIASRAGDETQFEEGTPERAVQRYLQAVEDSDATTALSFLSPALVTRCGKPERQQITQRGNSSIRATLQRSEVDGSSATVTIRLIETFREAPLGISDQSQTVAFELESVDGQWKFAEMPWPMEWYCAQPAGRVP